MAQDQKHDSIADPARIKALSSPVRQEIVDTLWALGGTATVADLAGQLGRTPNSLYYHLELLCRVGLVESEAIDTGERRLRLAGKRGSGPLRLAYRLGKTGNGGALAGYVRALLGQAERDFVRAAAVPDTVVDGARRELWAARNKGWVSPEAQEEIVGLLERLCELTSQSRSGADDRLLTLAFVMAPAAPRSGRRAAGG